MFHRPRNIFIPILASALNILYDNIIKISLRKACLLKIFFGRRGTIADLGIV
jgi:hypothetical protein